VSISKRLYLVAGLVALLAIAFSAVTLTSRLTSAQGSDETPAVQACDQQDEADDVAEATTKEADTDNIEEECGDQNEADDAAEPQQRGVLDDGKDLLPQAGITLDQAIAAAQSAASGPVGEVDLEHYQGKLVFNVDVGDKDVKVDAADGSIVAADSDD
jgi:uncharacterized membrane protein YkoI